MKPVKFFPETGHGLYREVTVWRRLDDDCALCYRCLEDLETGRFAVYGAEFHCPGERVGEPAKPPMSETDTTRGFLERFLDNTARRATDWGPTLVEAIARYDLRVAGPGPGSDPGRTPA